CPSRLNLLFFFFQAEDGIRDFHVTGVQTCALPILALVGTSGAGKSTIASLVPRLYDVDGGAVRLSGVDVRDLSFDSLRQTLGMRSEERRVGKECRARWSR